MSIRKTNADKGVTVLQQVRGSVKLYIVNNVAYLVSL